MLPGVGQAFFPKESVEFLQGRNLRHGHQEVALHKTYSIFYQTLLMGLAYIAKVGGKDVMAAQSDKRFLLGALGALKHLFDGRL